jgi:UDP-GlcNAc:undecaprenyl-phosphate GlcNAc-1-phosphate transferase
MIPTLIITPIFALLLSLLITPAVRKIAILVGLVDKPNFRKVHQNHVPLIGGIVLFATTVIALGVAIPFQPETFSLINIFLASFVILVMGVLDDRFDIRASLKLAIQLIVAHFIYMQGIRIENLNGLFGVYELQEWVQYILTIVVITGVVNAFNLMDGIDGLAAGLSIVGFSVFTVISFVLDMPNLSLVFLTFVGGLISFLYFNLSKKNKIFMGDAGSLVIGLILVTSSIKMLQTAVETPKFNLILTLVFLVMAVPVFDALRVFRKRIKSGKSPFDADRTHLHHLILSSGLKHAQASLIIIIFIVLLLALGYFTFYLTGVLFAISLSLFAFYSITYLLQTYDDMITWKGRIKDMEDKNN